mmetsp:Transcript_9429/g.13835  ORF Transcript_9429/g.13835 Transcript_9429/m.13835 type:complete len:241 (-) Transcript_9429:33-755(-)
MSRYLLAQSLVDVLHGGTHGEVGEHIAELNKESTKDLGVNRLREQEALALFEARLEGSLNGLGVGGRQRFCGRHGGTHLAALGRHELAERLADLANVTDLTVLVHQRKNARGNLVELSLLGNSIKRSLLVGDANGRVLEILAGVFVGEDVSHNLQVFLNSIKSACFVALQERGVCVLCVASVEFDRRVVSLLVSVQVFPRIVFVITTLRSSERADGGHAADRHDLLDNSASNTGQHFDPL